MPQAAHLSRRHFLAAGSLLLPFSVAEAEARSDAPVPGPLSPTNASLTEILAKLRASETTRWAALQAYTADREYVLNNGRFHKTARIQATLEYRYPGEKSFSVKSEDGPRILCEKVLRKAMQTEAEGSRNNTQDQSRIDTANYALVLLGVEEVFGHPCYVLQMTPKSKSPYLLKGHSWVSVSDHAIVRVQGVLAQRPSFWIGAPLITQTYFKSGDFWLPHSSVSVTEAPLFGKTDLTIASSGYRVRATKVEATKL